MIIVRKKIKFNNKSFFIGVYSYYNGRLLLKIENKKESHDITVDLKDAYVEQGHVLLDPVVTQNGLLRILKKKRIIRSICGIANYNYINIPVAKVNMGILKQYDHAGVMKYIEKILKGING